MQGTTDGRREVEELSGQKVVPVLVTDSGPAGWTRLQDPVLLRIVANS